MNPIIDHFSKLLSNKPYVNTTPRAGITRWVDPYLVFYPNDTLNLSLSTTVTHTFDEKTVFNTKADYELFRDTLSIEGLTDHVDQIVNNDITWRGVTHGHG